LSFIDFVFSFILALAASAFLFRGWYSSSLLAFLAFLLFIVNVALFHLRKPQPRYIVGFAMEFEPEEENEESDTKPSE
jgi:hypothetical protein